MRAFHESLRLLANPNRAHKKWKKKINFVIVIIITATATAATLFYITIDNIWYFYVHDFEITFIRIGLYSGNCLALFSICGFDPRLMCECKCMSVCLYDFCSSDWNNRINRNINWIAAKAIYLYKIENGFISSGLD